MKLEILQVSCNINTLLKLINLYLLMIAPATISEEYKPGLK